MERLRRAPAYCVIQNNIMLGGTPLMDENQNIIGDVDEANMINDGALFDWFPSKDGDHVYAPKLGYTPTTLSDHNFLRYDYNSVMEDPRNYNYTFRREILDEIASTLEEAEREAVLSLDPYKTGPTYGFDYKALGPVQKYLI